MPDTPTLLQRFQRIDRALHASHALWRPEPFQQLLPDWARDQPWLDELLLELDPSLPDEDVRALLGERIPALAELLPLVRLPALPPQRELAARRGLDCDVPGRKWAQIQAFARALPAGRGALLDWCAGKGHLARLAAHTLQQPVHCLERDPALCESGRRLAGRLSLPVWFSELDVLLPAAADAVDTTTHAIALHACGLLHRRLLELAIERRALSLSLAPCCYPLEPEGPYRPFSRAGHAALLQLQRSDLPLAVQETVTASQRVTRQRQQAKAWRLGFDLLQRQLTGSGAYLHVPSTPASWLQLGFGGFCRQLADLKGLTLPAHWDEAGFERRGWERLRQTTARERLRHAFRRPLELWLVLDRALALEEAGYRVQLGEFCERALTPRNLMIHAERC